MWEKRQVWGRFRYRRRSRHGAGPGMRWDRYRCGAGTDVGADVKISVAVAVAAVGAVEVQVHQSALGVAFQDFSMEAAFSDGCRKLDSTWDAGNSPFCSVEIALLLQA